MGHFTVIDGLVGNPDLTAKWPFSTWLAYGSPAYSSSNYLYFKGRRDQLKAFSIAKGIVATTPITSKTATPTNATPSVSLDSSNANPSTTEIVWTVEADTNNNNNAELRAFVNSGQSLNLIYDSSAQGSRDLAGPYVNTGLAYAPTIAS
jgi:hypothetical protein